MADPNSSRTDGRQGFLVRIGLSVVTLLAVAAPAVANPVIVTPDQVLKNLFPGCFPVGVALTVVLTASGMWLVRSQRRH